MKPSSLLFAALFAALLAASASAWPHPHPHFPPFPKHALPPSMSFAKPPMPSRDDVAKCLQTVRGAASLSCSPLSYDAASCCAYLSGLEKACDFVPYYETRFFKGIVAHVCAPPPPSS